MKGSKLKNIIAYRGEHGQDILQSRLACLSFSTLEVACYYAQNPNNRNDLVLEPKVISAQLSIEKPFINTPDDSFLELGHVRKALGKEFARILALKFSGHIVATDNWQDNFAHKYPSPQELIDSNSCALDDLYLLAYPVLDDSQVVSYLLSQGFDGACHGGSAISAQAPEYKVFNDEKIKILSIENLYENNRLRQKMF